MLYKLEGAVPCTPTALNPDRFIETGPATLVYDQVNRIPVEVLRSGPGKLVCLKSVEDGVFWVDLETGTRSDD